MPGPMHLPFLLYRVLVIPFSRKGYRLLPHTVTVRAEFPQSAQYPPAQHTNQASVLDDWHLVDVPSHHEWQDLISLLLGLFLWPHNE